MAFGDAERSDSTECGPHADKLLLPDLGMDEERSLSLAEFQALVGTNSDVMKIGRDQGKQSSWMWKWLKRDHLESQNGKRLYPKILREEKTALRQLYMFDTLVCTCLIFQLGIASALVILSAIGGDNNIIVAVLGAVTALIAGILSLVKGQGQPMRLINYADSLKKIRDDIEFCESGLQSGVTSAKYKQVLDVWGKYTSARDSQMKNRPDVWSPPANADSTKVEMKDKMRT
ncbi:hypothetical protein CNMCM8980_004875 [Aspergillus fumigatiaffinis]|nr:hypothetical protein CNMCM8980_004875 [Aspergillus fumigatiaffinis]